MSSQIQITGETKVKSLTGVLTGTSGVVGFLPIDVSLGIPQLDVNGKILVSQLPNSVMEYKGTWDASTNTPTLANGTGNQGDVYLCNVAGTVNFGAGAIAFFVGDQVIYSGSIWQRASGATGTVTSVAITESGDSLNITGSPITTSGTINIGFNGTNLQYVNGAGNLTTFPTLITSIGLSMPSAFSVANSPLTANGTIAVTGAGTTAQYIRGDGSLATFPTISAEAQRLITEVYNETGATLTKGTVVYINGGHGNLPTITKAIATGDATSAQTYGIVQTDITDMNNGYVVVIGSLTDLDTQAYANGTQLYLSSTTAGAWTSTKQYAPAHLVYVGIVTRSHPTQGVVEVRIQNGFEMDELHNVSAQSPLNNQGLFYNTSTSLWENKSIATALGYTPANDALVVHLAGTETITGAKNFNLGLTLQDGYYPTPATGYVGLGSNGSGITILTKSGITVYNNNLQFSNASNSYYFPNASGTIALVGGSGVGTVTSVAALTIGTTGTDLNSSVANSTTTPVITLNVPTASATNRGALSSADWTTFNNKQSALTNPVTGTGTTNYLPKFTGASTIGNSIMSESGSTISIAGGLTASGIIATSGTGLNSSVRIANTTASTGTDWHLYSLNNGNFGLYNNTAGAYAYQVTASGNLGLGVTPSAWYSTMKSITVKGSNGNGSSWYSGGSQDLVFFANGYYDAAATPTRNGTGGTAQYRINDAQHSWWTDATTTGAISLTQAMTLTAAGRLLINKTNEETYQLDVNGTGRFTGALNGTSATFSGAINLTGTANSFQVASIFRNANRVFFGGDTGGYYFQNSGNTATILNLNDSGNLGLGVTPSAWATVGPIIQFTAGGFIGSQYTANTFYVGQNHYYNGSNFIYNNNGFATQFQVGGGDGSFTWRVSPSGTAGNVITFTQAMTLTAAGNVLIGTTTDSGYKLDVNGTGRFSDAVTIRSSSVSSGGSAINAYGFDGAADLYTTRQENPYNAALYLHNNPISGQGYGTGILFRAKSDTINSRVQGNIYTTWTTATDASRTSKMVFSTTNSGTTSDKLTIEGTGAATFSSSVNIGTTLYVSSTATIAYNGLSGDFGAGYTIGLGVGYSSSVAKGINMGWNTTLDRGFIGTVHNGTAWKSLILCPIGGDVYIGATGNNNFFAGAATFSSSVTATSFFESSDSRLKTLIQDNYQTKGIASITPKLYTKNGKVELGYYAQDFVGILDSAVSKGSDDMLSLSYREVHTAKIYALEQEIKELKAKLN